MIDCEFVAADPSRDAPEAGSEDLAIYRRILLRAAAASESVSDLRDQDARATIGAVLVSVGACLVAEERPEEALFWLARAERFLDALTASDRYRYHLAQGDALGQMHRIPAMDAALSAARDVATYELGDPVAAEAAWLLLLMLACRNESWGWVARVTDAALAFAERTGDRWLQQRTARLLAREERVSGFEEATQRRPPPLCAAG